MTHLQIAKRHPLKRTFVSLNLIEYLAGFWQRRDLLWNMTVRHLRGQYKQSFSATPGRS